MAPLFGLVSDKYGKRIKVIILSIVFLLVGHSLFAFLPSYEEPNYIVILPLFCIGLFYSIYLANIWVCYSLVVDEKLIGTAYGLGMSILNIGLSIVPMIVGYLHDYFKDLDNKSGYFSVSLFFIFVSTLAFISAIGLHYHDISHNKILDKG